MRTAASGFCHSLLLGFLLACASATRNPAPGSSAPVPTTPDEAGQAPPAATTWSFSYLAGVSSYRVEREASIQNQSDSGTVQQETSNLTHELLTLERIGDTVQFTITADTFATSIRNSAVPTQVPTLPSSLAGVWTNDSLLIIADSLAATCNPVESALASDLHNLLVSFPSQLSRAMAWSDSVRLDGCQGGIPTIAQIKRYYRVSGDTVYEGSRLVIVDRTDAILAKGDGAQQQHRLLLSAIGSGSGRYYLDPVTGRVARLSTTQDIGLTITASGKSHNFRQRLKQEFVLAP